MKPFKNEARMSTEARLAVLENQVQNINATLLDFKHEMKRGFDQIAGEFAKIDKRFDRIDSRLDKVDDRFDKTDQKIERLDNRVWALFMWSVGMGAGLAGLIAHAQHWI